MVQFDELIEPRSSELRINFEVVEQPGLHIDQRGELGHQAGDSRRPLLDPRRVLSEFVRYAINNRSDFGRGRVSELSHFLQIGGRRNRNVAEFANKLGEILHLRTELRHYLIGPFHHVQEAKTVISVLGIFPLSWH